MSDPNEIGGISVTIKGDEPGGKFNDPKSPGTWIVFHGTPPKIREQICEVFQLELNDRPLFDLVNEATRLFKAAANVSQTLGGTVLNDGSKSSANASQSPPWPTDGQQSTDVFDQAAAARGGAEAKADVDPILAAIENSKTVAEVQQIWAENQDAFNANTAYMDAYRAKGKALSA